MLINGKKTNAKSFAYDGCHKIYLCETPEDQSDAEASGYSIYPIENLWATFEDSCALRFISNWQLDKSFVSQFEDAVFQREM